MVKSKDGDDVFKVAMPDPKYNPEYDVTVWDFPDHVLLAYGNVLDWHDAGMHPVWIKKTGGKFDLSEELLREPVVTIDVPGIDADDLVDERDLGESMY
jgi:hypothetical protein